MPLGQVGPVPTKQTSTKLFIAFKRVIKIRSIARSESSGVQHRNPSSSTVMKGSHQKTNQQHRQRRLLPRRPSLAVQRTHHTQSRQATSLKSSNAMRRLRRSQIRAYPSRFSPSSFCWEVQFLRFQNLAVPQILRKRPTSVVVASSSDFCCSWWLTANRMLTKKRSNKPLMQSKQRSTFRSLRKRTRSLSPHWP